MLYQTFPPRNFPGVRRDGSLGTRYEITFTAPGIVERDTVTVDDLDPKVIDELIKAKIASHQAVANLGK